MNYKCILIDLDDTILNTKLNSMVAIESVFYDYGFDRGFDGFDSFYKIYSETNIRLWGDYRNGTIDKDTLIVERFRQVLEPNIKFSIEQILRLNDDFLDRTTHQKALYPHAIELLEYLKPKYKLLIISNGFKEVQYKKMANAGLTDYFCDVILSDDVGYNKPAPQIFDMALRHAGVKSDQTIVIGDSLDADIQGAINAGLDNIWFNPNHEISPTIKPTYMVNDFIEIINIL